MAGKPAALDAPEIEEIYLRYQLLHLKRTRVANKILNV